MGRTQQLRQWVELWLGWLSKKRHLYQKLADQAVITTWSETSVFHLLRQASSTQKHSQQSSPPRRGPAGTWQDGDRKNSPLSLLLRATCWPLGSGSKPSGPECIYISSYTVAAPVAELGGCVPDRAGDGDFVAGAEPLRVDNCGGSVLL